MSDSPLYSTAIAAEWIDYNGHLRDAYYGLIVSRAADALMDRLGIDEAYRKRTLCTLYTLEMHIHFLREVKKSSTVEVAVRILASDQKRIHAAFDLRCAGAPDVVATAEQMLLHVHQGETPGTRAFPPEIAAAITDMQAASGKGAEAAGTPVLPGSRRIELRSRS
jgi:acyl-CoA thioester hydrolase